MSNQEDIAIKVEGVYKDFDLPHEVQNSIKARLLHPMARGKSIEKQHALNDISFEIKKGEFFGIVGRNGSGKSTLLKILAEIYTPTKGKVTVNGSLTPFIELGVGFNPELTGRENVYLNGAMLGFSTKEMEALYQEIVDFAELEKFMDQKLKNYSSGMQVRLAFSVAIRAKSDILLLDEVLAVGDEAFQRKCFNYFKQLKKDHKTVILVTHSMDAVREYCDKAAILEDSKLVDTGTASSIARQYSKLFLESDKSSANEQDDSTRFGSFEAKFSAIKVTSDDKKIVISSKILNTCPRKIDDLITGFSVSSFDGRILAGSNSRILELPTLSIPKKGTNIEWSLPNIFGDGTYYVNLALINKDDSKVDWFDEAKSFTVKREKPSNAPIYIEPVFKMN